MLLMTHRHLNKKERMNKIAAAEDTNNVCTKNIYLYSHLSRLMYFRTLRICIHYGIVILSHTELYTSHYCLQWNLFCTQCLTILSLQREETKTPGVLLQPLIEIVCRRKSKKWIGYLWQTWWPLLTTWFKIAFLISPFIAFLFISHSLISWH